MQNKLDPAGIRTLARRLCGEAQFDREQGQESSRPLDAEIQQLVEVVRIKGVGAVAAELKVSVAALKSWISGFYSPARSNLEKVRKYLLALETSPPTTEQPPEPGGELFGRQPERQSPQYDERAGQDKEQSN